jgi:hypothetical protein
MAPRGGAQERGRPPRPNRSGRGGAGRGWAGPGLGPEGARRTWARIFRMTAGSCSVAIRRSRPPQCGHARTSMANARCMRAAQVRARGVGFPPVPARPAASGGVEAVGSDATRPYTTTRARHRARGANTPWQMSRLLSGGEQDYQQPKNSDSTALGLSGVGRRTREEKTMATRATLAHRGGSVRCREQCGAKQIVVSIRREGQGQRRRAGLRAAR